jgi:hypothetical protein
MDELEIRLSELADGARRAAVAPGVATARRRGQVYRRVAQSGSALLLVAILFGGFAMNRAISDPGGGGVAPAGGGGAEPTPTPSPGAPDLAAPLEPFDPQWVTGESKPTGPVEVIAEGLDHGYRWRLSAFETRQGVCLSSETNEGGTGGCGEVAKLAPGGSATSLPWMIMSGWVSKDTQLVRFELFDGRIIDTKPIRTGDRFPVDFYQAFVPAPPSGQRDRNWMEKVVRRTFTLDSTGNVLCREYPPGSGGVSCR